MSPLDMFLTMYLVRYVVCDVRDAALCGVVSLREINARDNQRSSVRPHLQTHWRPRVHLHTKVPPRPQNTQIPTLKDTTTPTKVPPRPQNTQIPTLKDTTTPTKVPPRPQNTQNPTHKDTTTPTKVPPRPQNTQNPTHKDTTTPTKLALQVPMLHISTQRYPATLGTG
ncbi:putative uncharacterized protein DDB_G0290521 [Penaeus monodon]|uniref:putative uncharacterized protein DDB_G0290521 n=1 Tax=Penaeus monodon TaxID=6687 RepID=UPI0018A762E5|nr:putative uncharacterized protein DDB_G0290521 [Penaeus monodon]